MTYTIGTGAIGLFLASKLSLVARSCIVARSEASARPWVNGILIGESGEKDLSYSPQVTYWGELKQIPDGSVVVLATKVPELESALRDLSLVCNLAQNHLIFIQNGIGVLEGALRTLPELRPGQLTRAAVWIGARRLPRQVPGRVQVSGQGGVEWAGGSIHAVSVWADQLRRAGVGALQCPDPRALEWRKALSNLAINGLCALENLPNGAILERSDLRLRAKAILSEAVQVAGRMGVQIEPQDIDQVWKIAQITAQNRNSMLGDLEAGRITEVGWLNGAVARLGNEFGIATPENQNLFSLISALENSRGKG